MRTKKIILTLLVCLSLMLSQQTYAARLVPKNAPLQPMPEDTTPNVSNNVNTENSDINTNLGSQVPESSTPDDSNPNTDTDSVNSDQTPPIVGSVSTSSTTFYWVLFIVGLLGLIGVGIWTYIRFVRKPE